MYFLPEKIDKSGGAKKIGSKKKQLPPSTFFNAHKRIAHFFSTDAIRLKIGDGWSTHIGYSVTRKVLGSDRNVQNIKIEPYSGKNLHTY
jgi:hypothetical protein